MRQRVEGVSLGWRQARVTADGARAQARARREVVRREEEGLRLAEELSEECLLVAVETLELAAAEQAQRQHTLERKAHVGRAAGAEGAAVERGVPRTGRCAVSRRRRRRWTSAAATSDPYVERYIQSVEAPCEQKCPPLAGGRFHARATRSRTCAWRGGLGSVDCHTT